MAIWMYADPPIEGTSIEDMPSRGKKRGSKRYPKVGFWTTFEHEKHYVRDGSLTVVFMESSEALHAPGIRRRR